MTGLAHFLGMMLATRRRRAVVLHVWRLRLRAGVGRERVVAEALGLARRLIDLDQLQAAREVYAVTEQLQNGHPEIARVTAARAAVSVAEGELPADLCAALAGLLDLADNAWRAGDDRACTWRLADALALAFNRNLHFTRHALLTSAPESFLAPFLKSTAFAALTRPTSRARVDAGIGSAERVLFVSYQNWNFIRDIIEDYRRAGLEVRTLDLSEHPDAATDLAPLVRARLSLARSGTGITPPPAIRELLEWADTVFVEWGSRQLAWVSLLDRPPPRLVARVHSYEVSTASFRLVDWSVVSDLIFVADGIRTLAEKTSPGLVGTRRHTIRNRNELEHFVRPKDPGADHTIALVGWGTERKDPAWALDTLDHLRAQDDRWRLLLIGSGPDDTAAGSPYYRSVFRRIASLGGAVQQTGPTSDVASVLQRAAVILSASRREGTHEGFIEGVASGAFPVVRDWPDLARWGGPSELFPAEWVVATPHDAAARIIDWANADDRAHQVVESQAWIVDHFAWSRVRPLLDAVVLGVPQPGNSSVGKTEQEVESRSTPPPPLA